MSYVVSGPFVASMPSSTNELDPSDWCTACACVTAGSSGTATATSAATASTSGARLGGPNWNASPGGPNTNIGGFAGKSWAMVEAGGTPAELDGNLDSVARDAFEGTLPNGFSAHPKYDAATSPGRSATTAAGQR